MKRLLVIFCLFAVLFNVANVQLTTAYDDTSGLQVHIKKEHRVFNRSKNQCIWCVLESLSYHNKIKQLYGLTENKDAQGRASYEVIEQAMKNFGVPLHQALNHDTSLIKYGCKQRVGVGVVIYVYWAKKKEWGTHAVTLVHYDKKEVKYIDNADPTLSIKVINKTEFNKIWTGWSFLITKPVKQSPKWH